MSPSLFQSYLLARKDSPQTSKDAAKRMVESGELSRQEQQIYDAILKSAKKDFTTKNIAAWMFNFTSYDKAYDICRKRFSGLQMKGKIELVKVKKNITDCTFIYVDKRRDGCRVWRLK